jgi:hypothetical protein
MGILASALVLSAAARAEDGQQAKGNASQVEKGQALIGQAMTMRTKADALRRQWADLHWQLQQVEDKRDSLDFGADTLEARGWALILAGSPALRAQMQRTQADRKLREATEADARGRAASARAESEKREGTNLAKAAQQLTGEVKTDLQIQSVGLLTKARQDEGIAASEKRAATNARQEAQRLRTEADRAAPPPVNVNDPNAKVHVSAPAKGK